VDWLVDTIASALAVWDTAEGGTWQQTNATWDDTGLVADDVTEEVAGDDDTVQGSWVLDHQHGSGIDEVVTDLHLWELLGHDLGDHLSPQSRCGEHIGLVEGPDWKGWVVLEGEVRSETRDTLNLWARVWLGVPGGAVTIVLLSLAKVDATGQFADDVEVDIAADLGLERRDVDEGFRGEVARSKVTIGAELLAQSEDTLLWTDLASSPFGSANGSEEDGVGGLGGFESL
jgi:hypothetical protein